MMMMPMTDADEKDDGVHELELELDGWMADDDDEMTATRERASKKKMM